METSLMQAQAQAQAREFSQSELHCSRPPLARSLSVKRKNGGCFADCRCQQKKTLPPQSSDDTSARASAAFACVYITSVNKVLRNRKLIETTVDKYKNDKKKRTLARRNSVFKGTLQANKRELEQKRNPNNRLTRQGT